MTSPVFANVLILSAAAFFAVLLGYSLITVAPYSYAATLQIFLAICVAALLISLKFPHQFKVNFSVLLVSTGVSLVVAEIFLDTASRKSSDGYEQAAASAGVEFDNRSKMEVVSDLREAKVDAFPFITPGMFTAGRRELTIDGVNPLGSISNATLVWCNETGERGIYQSDERGFHNPKGIWGQDQVDVVLIGDSFVNGACVRSEANLGALIRNVYPETLNLGSGGSGPLIQLAIIKEYLGELRPNVVLWFYWEGNDLFDLTEEYPFLPGVRRYLEPDYRQNLASRQERIDAGLKAMADPESSDPLRGSIWKEIRNIITLRQLRTRLVHGTGVVRNCLHAPATTTVNFDRILRAGKTFVNSWGGDLYFVYLPTWERYADPDRACGLGMNDDFKRHDEVISIAKSTGLEVIDVSSAFDAHSDPLSLFPFRINAHYNEDGYRVVAEAVLEVINSGETD